MAANKTDVVNDDYFGNMIRWTAFIFFFLMVVLTVLVAIGITFDLISLDNATSKLSNPIIVIIKTSFSATMSFLVVIILRYTSGPIEYEVASLKFKGATGPVILWIFCFIVIVAGMALLAVD